MVNYTKENQNICRVELNPNKDFNKGEMEKILKHFSPSINETSQGLLPVLYHGFSWHTDRIVYEEFLEKMNSISKDGLKKGQITAVPFFGYYCNFEDYENNNMVYAIVVVKNAKSSPAGIELSAQDTINHARFMETSEYSIRVDESNRIPSSNLAIFYAKAPLSDFKVTNDFSENNYILSEGEKLSGLDSDEKIMATAIKKQVIPMGLDKVLGRQRISQVMMGSGISSEELSSILQIDGAYTIKKEYESIKKALSGQSRLISQQEFNSFLEHDKRYNDKVHKQILLAITDECENDFLQDRV
ncbi:MAG: hypothetical protein PHN56_00290 [Candidatus Nanoarchaeia archaeon]|nr:hypothetical protein [Candidatus Nanoarchaeia archaeon]